MKIQDKEIEIIEVLSKPSYCKETGRWVMAVDAVGLWNWKPIDSLVSNRESCLSRIKAGDTILASEEYIFV